MILTIKKEVEEMIEIELPAYFKDIHDRVIKVAEDCLIVAGPNILVRYDKSSYIYESEAKSAIKGEPSTEADFVNACSKMITILNQQISNAKEMAWDEATR